MTVHKSILTAAVAVVLAVWSESSVSAADYPGIPPAVVGQPNTVASPAPVSGCPTCTSAAAPATGCKSCAASGSTWFFKREKGASAVNLCPGACFGYFQTQWRKWDDVCPYPYQGVGVSDAPKPPAPTLPTPGKTGTTVPSPRPVDPKPGDGKPMSYNTPIPIPVPGNQY